MILVSTEKVAGEVTIFHDRDQVRTQIRAMARHLGMTPEKVRDQLYEGKTVEGSFRKLKLAKGIR